LFVAFWGLTISPSLAEERGQAAASRDGVACGPNAALMFMTLCGVNVDDSAINSIPCGEEGASLLELRDFCESHGMPAEVRQFRADEILTMPLPAIWQTRFEPKGHYFVVYRINGSTIHAIDATTGEDVRPKRERFEGYYTGYALVPKRSLVGHLLNGVTNAMLAFWLLAVLNVALLIVLIARPKPQHR